MIFKKKMCWNVYELFFVYTLIWGGPLIPGIAIGEVIDKPPDPPVWHGAIA